MEQKIKNFDRSIEQMMNEHQVTPPFGMWNRISSELDAMPIAAATPVATSPIPKRAMTGIIVAALLLGTSIVTGYLVNSALNKNKQDAAPGVASTQIAAPVKAVAVQQERMIVKKEIVPTLAKVRVKHIVATDPVQATMLVAEQVNPVVNQPVNCVPSNTNSFAVNNSNTDVPAPVAPVAKGAENEVYYFPAIDVVSPEKSKPANETPGVSKNRTEIAAAPEVEKDEKPSNNSGRKINFKPPHRTKYRYPKIIRNL